MLPSSSIPHTKPSESILLCVTNGRAIRANGRHAPEMATVSHRTIAQKEMNLFGGLKSTRNGAGSTIVGIVDCLSVGAENDVPLHALTRS